MKEYEPPNNVIQLEEYRKRKEALTTEIESAIQSGLESIGTDTETEFKFLSEIYSDILQTLARKFAGISNYDLGSKSYDSQKATMLLTFAFSEKKFDDFLNLVKKSVYLIPNVMRERMTVYIGEHDNFLDTTAAKIDQHGFTAIENPETVPLHKEDSLRYNEGEFEKLRDIAFTLREKLRKLFEIE